MATTDKYDRQLRLWGAAGQRALMRSRILLINATAVGSETLKNLVLPGVGHFTILDDHILDDSDLGCNFFATPSALGRPRAEIITELLNEMNEDVKGSARVANFGNVLSTEPEFYTGFDLVIATNLPEGQQLLTLADLCWSASIPLALVRSYGLIGTFRLQLRMHEIVESKVDGDVYDLRIMDTFPELKSLLEEYSFADLDSMEHAHVPYVAILHRALTNWKLTHEGKVPSSYAEKEAFKAEIKGMSRDFSNEINFQDAVRESYRAYTRVQLSPEAEEVVLGQSDAFILNTDSRDFEFLVAALKAFMEKSGDSSLPLSGQIPDMTATNQNYVQLQRVYQLKAMRDLEAFKLEVQQLLRAVGRVDNSISEEDMAVFCRNAPTIQRLITRSVRDEICPSLDQSLEKDAVFGRSGEYSSQYLNGILSDELYDADPSQTPLLWYLALRAVDRFYSKYARWPGVSESALSSDEAEVYAMLCLLRLESKLGIVLTTDGNDSTANGESTEANAVIMQVVESDTIQRAAIGSNIPQDYFNSAEFDKLLSRKHAVEITRYGGGELHNISALIGGVAAQEAVKVLTHQYVPINNTYVYNGICSVGSCYEL